MDFYLLISDPAITRLCTGALEPLRPRLHFVASADALSLHGSSSKTVHLLTTADTALSQPDHIARMLDTGFVRLAVICLDTSTAAAVSETFGPKCDIVTHPIDSSLRSRAADWHRLEAMQSDANVHTRQMKDMTALLETSTQDMAALKQKIAFLDRQDDRLSGVLDTLNLLGKIAQEINSLDLEEIITACVTRIPLLVNARYASLYMHNYAASTLELKRNNHGYRIDELIRLVEPATSVMAFAVSEKKILLIRDFEEYERLHGITVERPNARKYTSRSCMIVPMLAGDRVVAVLNLADKRTGEPFDETTDLPPLEQLSIVVGSAIRNWQLFQEVKAQARMDAMTHFMNHQTFFEHLETEVLRVRRYHGALSVLMVDVDNFKLLNDVHGHPLGDKILLEVSRIIRVNIRDTDMPARYGGDEFAIILAQADAERARMVAERIREMVEAQRFMHEDTKVNLSLSIGVAQYRPGQSVTEFIAEADKALYEAKARGRNCVATVVK
jgi:diguanylate cyclase (GGDEF)-like protein